MYYNRTKENNNKGEMKMAEEKTKLKSGMAGSNGGSSRWATTEVLKKASKKRRRRLDKEIINKEK